MHAKLFIVIIAVYAVTANEVGILHQEAEINQDGSYKFNYESEDGTKVSQTGSLKNVNNKDVQVAEGSYSYHGDDGKDVVVQYIADENGYRPIGDNIPASIVKNLEVLATAKPPKDN
ncbi:PREDICTED: endocuticle structural glycoprotein SgAbd-5-like [Nicrophorus vespilloides]|uniref:Endocuticle structural glycoprotein SgAbd-5-like n=1 Tax=Nicrophorus vespilloides TaxID=110193 RepID=A0ABM1NFZ0_NICVS|nr:PREDICTED: endocuticle structural glycoprotein SgAbd-5-like [Nicrophorus vespilloides]